MEKIIKLLSVSLLIFFFSFAAYGQNQFNVLLYTHQEEWHKDNIPSAVEAFRKMSIQHQFEMSWTMDADDLAKQLNDFDVVVFLNADADRLSDSQMEGLKKYMNQGGGFVGIHATASGKIRKPWFDKLVGGVFIDHPKLQSGVLKITDSKFPSNLHLGETWLWSDEWYNFTNVQYENINVVLTVEESSYDYTLGYDEIPLKGMGENHPIAWHQLYEGGRSFYTALGHKKEAFENQKFLDHIYGGVYWATQQK